MPAWPNLQSAFKDQFPDITEFVIEQEHNRHPWQVKEMKKFCGHLVRKYDDGTEALLVGHSMGGVVACAIADKFKRTRIGGIVTIFSPHTSLRGIFHRVLGAAEDLNIPVVSFGASADRTVWWGTRHPRSVAHIVLPSDHKTALVVRKELAQEIAVITKRELFPENSPAI